MTENTLPRASTPNQGPEPLDISANLVASSASLEVRVSLTEPRAIPPKPERRNRLKQLWHWLAVMVSGWAASKLRGLLDSGLTELIGLIGRIRNFLSRIGRSERTQLG